MKKVTLALAICFSALFATAQPPKGDALVGDFYGQKPTALSIEKAVDASQLTTMLASKDSADVSIRGVVTEVCDKKGCWFKLKTDNNEEVMVKMKDYGFFVPVSLKGKTVVMDGQAKMKSVSVKELQHYAEDAGKTKAEIDAIKEPKTEVRYLASGITVVN